MNEPRGCPTPGACSAAARIAALEAEVERLRQLRDDDGEQLLAEVTIHERCKSALRAATERAQAAEQDARRYRWLREEADCPLLREASDLLTGQELDAAIDAALAAPQGEP